MSFEVDGVYADEDRDGLTYCMECLSVSDGDHCPACSDGLCVCCGQVVPKGTGIFEVELYCADCDAAFVEAELREAWPAWCRDTYAAVAEAVS